MFRQYREIQPEEFVLVAGDCSQGGDDSNCCQFFSATNLDVPLIYHSKGVANTMTNAIYPVVEKIANITGVKPVVGYERNMGGASEMDRLSVLNRLNKYKLFNMPKIGSDSTDDTESLGFNTNSLTRPLLVGGLKELIDVNGIDIYDQDTIDELSVFIVNPRGKPEAAKGAHDDTVIALALAVFMFKNSKPVSLSKQAESVNTTILRNSNSAKKWSLR